MENTNNQMIGLFPLEHTLSTFKVGKYRPAFGANDLLPMPRQNIDRSVHLLRLTNGFVFVFESNQFILLKPTRTGLLHEQPNFGLPHSSVMTLSHESVDTII